MAHGKIHLTSSRLWIESAVLWVIWISGVCEKTVKLVLYRRDMIVEMIRWKGLMVVPCERYLILCCYVSLSLSILSRFFLSSCSSLSPTASLFVPLMDREWRTQLGLQTYFKTRAVTINSSFQLCCWVCWEFALISYADTTNRWPWFYQDISRSCKPAWHNIAIKYICWKEPNIVRLSLCSNLSLHKPHCIVAKAVIFGI